MSAAHEDTTGSGLGGVSGGGLEGGATSAGGTGGTGGTSSAGGGGGATASGALAAGLGGLAGRLPNGGASLLNRLAEGSPLPVHDHLTPSTGGPIDYLRTQWGTDHLAAADPHAQYATDADLTAYATDADLAAHAAAADPHPVYLTPAEGDARFLTPAEGDGRYPLKTDPDPYPQYLTAAELPPATDVTVTTDASLTATESPANTFALAVRLSPDAGNALALRGNGLYGTDTTGGTGTTDVTLTTDASLTATESPANTFALATRRSATAGNALTLNADGLFVPDFLTQAEGDARYPLAGATDPYPQYATDADLAAHAAAADPHPVYLTQAEGDGRYPLAGAADPYPQYLTQAEGDGRYLPLSYTPPPADVTITTDASLSSTESPANTFALAARRSAAAGNVLALNGDGLFVPDAPTKDHTHQGPGSGGVIPYVDETGDTVTGTLAFQGAAVDAGGAVRVTSPAVAATDTRGYGPSSPALAPSATSRLSRELGLRFTPAGAVYLVAVRWYRQSAGQLPPTRVALWDTTATATPVWTLATLPDFGTATVGWREQRLAGGTPPQLVAGRTYALTYSSPATTSTTEQAGYTPVPDAGLAFVNHTGNATAAGTYPSATGTSTFGLDGAFRTTLVASDPAQSGAVRLPNGSAGAVAWRNGAAGADLALTANASDQLVFNGAALLNQATADALFLTPAEGDAAYLNVGGDTATGALVLQGAAGSANALQTKLAADTQPRFRVDASGLHEWGPGGSTAPETTLQRTAAQQLAANSTLTLTPAAGQPALFWAQQRGSLREATTTPGDPVLYSQGFLFVNPLGNYVLPDRANAIGMGSGALMWTAVYATNGTIQPSAADVKEDITPLDPADALAAVLATDPVTFTYTAPAPTAEQYELPDDPEQAEQVLHERLVNAPLMEAARSQAGFVLASPDYATDPLFETGAGQSNAANSAGVLLAALHEIDRRLTAGGL